MTFQFRRDLEKLINKHSLEGGSNTQDFLLAEMLCGVLEVFDRIVTRRDELRVKSPVKFEEPTTK